MDITEFFQQSAGKWFSQRTNHYINPPYLEAGKTDLWIDILESSDPEVVKLCEQNKIDASIALSGIRVKWDGKVGTEERTQAGSKILVVLANPNDPKTGQLLTGSYANEAPSSGRYILGNDDALTLITESPSISIEERIWFESANLRMRTSTVKGSNGYSVASFCSEIRMGGAKRNG